MSHASRDPPAQALQGQQLGPELPLISPQFLLACCHPTGRAL